MNPLKTVMAAILAAFSVMSSLPASAFVMTGTTVPATKPAQSADENSAINILADLIKKNKKAQSDVSARIQQFLLSPDFKGRSYVTPELPKDPSAKTIPALITQWVEKHPGDAAKLYYVARPLDGKVPEWVTKAPKGELIFKDDEKSQALPERLGNYLAGTDQQHPAGSQIGTVAVSGMTNSLAKFLDGAALGAGVILDPGVPATPEEARRAAERGDNPVNVPTTKPGGNPLDGSGSGFEFDDLYVKGAYVAEVYSPKDEGYRRLSVKMYTTTDDKGNVQNQIGIVDITPNDPKTPYGPKLFPMNQSEGATFSLRDGGRSYELSLKMADGKHNLVIKRPGTKEDSGAGVVAVSMEELAMRRMDQVAERGTLDIGGKPYYALGQGGSKGSILFFAKDEIDGRAGQQDPRWTAPKAMAAVSEVAPGGGTRRVGTVPGPDLGKIDGKPYHLEFDSALQIWRVTPGPGYIPPAPKEPVVVVPGGKPGTTRPTDPVVPGEVKTLADVVALLKANGFQEPNPDGNAGFSDDMKKVAHILVNPKGEPPFCFVFAPGLRADNQWCPGEVEGDTLVGIRGFDNYGVVEYGNTKQYLSLEFFAGKEGTKPSGIYGKGGMTEVKDAYIALDMLETYEKFPEADLTAIEERLDKHTEGPYLISSNKEKKMVLIRNITEKKTYRVWPTEGEGGTGGNAGLEDRKGPGTAVDLSFGPDADFPKELPFDATQKMLLQKASEDGGTALYQMDDAAAGEKKWFVMVRATLDGTPARSRHVQIFGTGKDWNALPEAYTLKGYASTEVPRTAKMGLVLGEGGKKGALSFYKFVIPAKDGSNVKDKKGNCVGPLVWWGADVDEAKAVAACRAGKF